MGGRKTERLSPWCSRKVGWAGEGGEIGVSYCRLVNMREWKGGGDSAGMGANDDDDDDDE